MACPYTDKSLSFYSRVASKLLSNFSYYFMYSTKNFPNIASILQIELLAVFWVLFGFCFDLHRAQRTYGS